MIVRTITFMKTMSVGRTEQATVMMYTSPGSHLNLWPVVTPDKVLEAERASLRQDSNLRTTA